MILVASIGYPKLIPKWIADRLNPVVLEKLVYVFYYLCALVLLLAFTALASGIVRLVLAVMAALLIILLCWHLHTSMQRIKG